MPPRYIVPFLAIAASFPALAEQEDLSQYGSLNPDEMTLERQVARAANGDTSMMVCASGYLLTKSGQHGNARTVFGACSDAGYSQAMTWMSQLDNNGAGGAYDPEAAAEWDRRAAETGDPVGMFNYGISLMRGHGVAEDPARGRALVDQAAELGLPIAKRLQGAGYDLDEITPDADDWKYQKNFF